MIAFIIPCFNHGPLLQPVLEQLSAYPFPCIVVDDGSNTATKHALAQIQKLHAKQQAAQAHALYAPTANELNAPNKAHEANFHEPTKANESTKTQAEANEVNKATEANTKVSESQAMANKANQVMANAGASEANAPETETQLSPRLPKNLIILTHRVNQGKGAAVFTALKEARRLGCSHTLQVDADGQHDLKDIPGLLKLSAQHPECIISGQSIYGDDIPKGRLYGRKITDFWVSIETWSNELKESMCGFRVYPVASVLKIFETQNIGLRMDFDIEILVRFYWQQGRHSVYYLPTKVIYPENGTSNFRMVVDNLRISKMHTRLFFSMLCHQAACLFSGHKSGAKTTSSTTSANFTTNRSLTSLTSPAADMSATSHATNVTYAAPGAKNYAADINSTGANGNAAGANGNGHAAGANDNGNGTNADAANTACDTHGAGANAANDSYGAYGANAADSADAEHWSQQKELKGLTGLRLTLWLQRIMGRRLSHGLVYPVVLVYYLIAAHARKASTQFLRQATYFHAQNSYVPRSMAVSTPQELSKLRQSQLHVPSSYRHFCHFASSLLDKLEAWRGELTLGKDIVFAPGAYELLQQHRSQGCVLLTSHLGNIDVARALSYGDDGFTVNALVYEDNAAAFRDVMVQYAPHSRFNLIPAAHVGPETAILMQDKLQQNEWVAIAGDRISIHKGHDHTYRTVLCSFLGQTAPFAEGPFLLAYLMQRPILQMFALKHQGKFTIFVHQLPTPHKVPRNQRTLAVHNLILAYVANLEYYAARFPLEWFNFYDFWHCPPEANTIEPAPLSQTSAQTPTSAPAQAQTKTMACAQTQAPAQTVVQAKAAAPIPATAPTNHQGQGKAKRKAPTSEATSDLAATQAQNSRAAPASTPAHAQATAQVKAKTKARTQAQAATHQGQAVTKSKTTAVVKAKTKAKARTKDKAKTKTTAPAPATNQDTGSDSKARSTLSPDSALAKTQDTASSANAARC